jgi:hypothetical protein
MVSVTFHGVCQGTCSWCRKEKNEVFLVSDKVAREPRPWCWGCLENRVWNEIECANAKPGMAHASSGGADSGRLLS